jgi:hypothetical protein
MIAVSFVNATKLTMIADHHTAAAFLLFILFLLLQYFFPRFSSVHRAVAAPHAFPVKSYDSLPIDFFHHRRWPE